MRLNNNSNNIGENFKNNLNNFLSQFEGDKIDKMKKMAIISTLFAMPLGMQINAEMIKNNQDLIKSDLAILLKLNNVNVPKNYDLKHSNVIITGDLIEDTKNTNAELFADSINDGIFLNGFEQPLLTDILKNAIIKDITNSIKIEDKELFANYILNKEKYTEKEYLNVKNKFIDILEKHNNEFKDFKVDENYIKELKSVDFDKTNLTKAEDIISNLKNIDFSKKDINSIDFENSLNDLSNTNLISEKTKEIIDNYQEVKKHRDNFLNDNSLESKNILDSDNEDINKYNKINNLYNESLKLVYNSVQQDLLNGIRDRQALYDNTGRKFKFLEEDIKKIDYIKNAFINPETKLLLDEKELFENKVNGLNNMSKEYKDLDGFFSKINNEKKLNIEEQTMSNISYTLYNFREDLFGLNEILNDKVLFDEIKDLNTLNKNIKENNNLTKDEIHEMSNDLQNRILNLLDWINYKYNVEFNEKLAKIGNIDKVKTEIQTENIVLTLGEILDNNGLDDGSRDYLAPESDYKELNSENNFEPNGKNLELNSKEEEEFLNNGR